MSGKRRAALTVILVIAMTLTWAICSANAARRSFSIASGWVSGTYYPFAGAVSHAAWKTLQAKNLKITVESSGTSVDNAKLIGLNDADFALLRNDIASHAYNGIMMFKKPVRNLTGCMTLYPEAIQIVARKDAGIKLVSDLKGKRVSIGPAGSGTAESAKQILAAYGLKTGDIKAEQMHAFQAAENIKDGRLDAFFNTTVVGAAHIIDTFELVPCMIVPVEGPEAKALIKKYPFYANDVVKPGVYKGSDTPVKTVAVMAMLAARADLEAGLVYDILNAIYADLPQIKKAHAMFKEISLEKALNGMSVPLHPGAEKFYRDKGMLN